jgi:hypothetical protein
MTFVRILTTSATCAAIAVAAAGALTACSSSHTSDKPTHVVTPADQGTPARAEKWTAHTEGDAPSAGSCTLATISGLPAPDRDCAPGVAVNDITPTNVADTACTASFAKQHRISAASRSRDLAELLRAYGLRSGPKQRYQLAFVIPPALGGANDLRNLWPMPVKAGTGQTVHDRVLETVTDSVCGKHTGLQAAQFAVSYSWPAALQRLRLG